jgi:ribosomal protein S15P/S13E
VLLTTQIGLRFIYGYIVARRKGLVEQFVKQQAKEFNTEEQIKQLIDEVEKLLKRLRK